MPWANANFEAALSIGAFRVTRITRYILREISVPCALAMVVLGFMGIANELRERAGDFDMGHINILDFARLSVWFFPTLLQYLVPAMYMLGVMLAFGRLAQNSEITAMKAAGIPLKRLVIPVILGGALLSAISFVAQDRIQPMALRNINSLIYSELPKRVTMDVMTPGVMYAFGNWRVYIGGRDRASNSLKDVDILQTQDNGEVWLYHANSAQFIREGGRGRLHIPSGYLIMPGQHGRGSITDWNLYPPEPKEQTLPSTRRLLTFQQLLREDQQTQARILKDGGLDSMRGLYTPISKLEIPENVSINDVGTLYKIRNELRDRLAFPLACVAVSLVAAPLAVRGGRGGRSFSFAIGFGVCVLYYFLHRLSQPWGLCSLEEAMLRGALPCLILGIFGLWAVWRVDNV